MKSKHTKHSADKELLAVEEVRLVSDLRIMHSKVDELYHIVNNLKRRHSQNDIHRYADAAVLTENIGRVDEIYLWFLKLKETAEARARLRSNS